MTKIVLLRIKIRLQSLRWRKGKTDFSRIWSNMNKTGICCLMCRGKEKIEKHCYSLYIYIHAAHPAPRIIFMTQQAATIAPEDQVRLPATSASSSDFVQVHIRPCSLHSNARSSSSTHSYSCWGALPSLLLLTRPLQELKFMLDTTTRQWPYYNNSTSPQKTNHSRHKKTNSLERFTLTFYNNLLIQLSFYKINHKNIIYLNYLKTN